MLTKILEKVENIVYVFVAVLLFLIISLVLNFSKIDLIYLSIVLISLVRYLKLKLS